MRTLANTLGLLFLAAPLCLPAYADDGHPDVWNYTGKADGVSPRGDLLIDAQGVLYGTTSVAGAYNNGAVFKITPPVGGIGQGTETTLWSFTGGADGSIPSAGLAADAQGALYTTAAIDGANQYGTVIQLIPPTGGQTAWTENTIWSFGGGNDGRTPVGNLLVNDSGAVFGTTNWGGANGYGIVFKLLPPRNGRGTWTEFVLWNFTGGVDGSQPVAGLVADRSGAVYGTTKAGGGNNAGVVFKLTPSDDGSGWSETTLWSFSGATDGSTPTDTLIFDANGALYGTTQEGGALTVNCAQSRFPYYGESQAQNEPALYAPYLPPGANECGTVFKLSPPTDGSTSWNMSTLYDFSGQPDGAMPAAGVTMLPDGSVIGLATELGQRYYGTAFRIVPPAADGQPWTYNLVASFNGKKEGFYPRGGLSIGLAGRAYGTTTVGGASWTHDTIYGYGSLFSSDPYATRHSRP